MSTRVRDPGSSVRNSPPSGKVTFFVDGTSIGKTVVMSDGVATLSHSFKQGGTYAVTAVLAKMNSTSAVTSDPVSVSVNR